MHADAIKETFIGKSNTTLIVAPRLFSVAADHRSSPRNAGIYIIAPMRTPYLS